MTVSKQVPAVSASLPEVEDGYPDSLLEGEVIDLNTASAADLTRLPGIGEKRAQAIVDYRESSGPFQSVEELTEVKGIGEGILAQVYDYVTVGDRTHPLSKEKDAMAKILIVDDERVLVKGIKFNLEHEGYQVQDAYDGEEAVELAREGAST